MLDSEFELLINDVSKTIDGDIYWIEDEDHSPTLEFRAEVLSLARYPLFVRGSFNSTINTLTYALIHRAFGRIYALDIGKDHHNPTCQYVGELHKHRWSEVYRDKVAYVPSDITVTALVPLEVWVQFCSEAKMTHNGIMHPIPPLQLELFE